MAGFTLVAGTPEGNLIGVAGPPADWPRHVPSGMPVAV